jgi:hypothetical protein
VGFFDLGLGIQRGIAMNLDRQVKVEGFMRADVVEHLPECLRLAGQLGQRLDLASVEVLVLQLMSARFHRACDRREK